MEGRSGRRFDLLRLRGLLGFCFFEPDEYIDREDESGECGYEIYEHHYGFAITVKEIDEPAGVKRVVFDHFEHEHISKNIVAGLQQADRIYGYPDLPCIRDDLFLVPVLIERKDENDRDRSSRNEPVDAGRQTDPVGRQHAVPCFVEADGYDRARDAVDSHYREYGDVDVLFAVSLVDIPTDAEHRGDVDQHRHQIQAHRQLCVNDGAHQVSECRKDARHCRCGTRNDGPDAQYLRLLFFVDRDQNAHDQKSAARRENGESDDNV